MVKRSPKTTGKKNQSLSAVENVDKKRGNSWVGDLTYPIRDVLIASMSNGLFLIAVMALVIVTFVYRLPDTELRSFAKDVYRAWKDLSIIGWVLWLISCGIWLFHVRFISKRSNKEIIRLAGEKDKYQKQLFERATTK